MTSPDLSFSETPDPCPDVATPDPQAAEAKFYRSMSELSYCLSPLLAPVVAADDAFVYLPLFGLDHETELPDLSDEDLRTLCVAAFESLDLAELVETRYRARFEDSEFATIQRLVARLHRAAAQLEYQVLASVRAHRALFEHFSGANDRARALLALLDTVDRME